MFQKIEGPKKPDSRKYTYRTAQNYSLSVYLLRPALSLNEVPQPFPERPDLPAQRRLVLCHGRRLAQGHLGLGRVGVHGHYAPPKKRKFIFCYKLFISVHVDDEGPM